jgi:hypothetical protein
MKPPRRIGKCIYCHTTEGKLSDEHITPFALNGDRILLEASCKACADITSAFETTILNRTLFAARAALRTRTRRPQERRKPRRMFIERGGNLEEIEVGWKDQWKAIPLPIFKKPAYLEGRPYAGGIEEESRDLVELDEKGDEVARRHGADKVLFDSYSPKAFARLLAKMAYGYAVDRYGINAFEEVYITSAILGHSDDIGRWVGCDDKRYFKAKKNYFVTVGFRIISRNELVVRIKLFPLFDGTEYLIIVGRMKEALVGLLYSVGRNY